MMKILLLIVVLLLSTSACITDPRNAGGASRLIQLAGLPSHYSAEAIEGWVVDTETGEPLEEVIVVALWALYETWDNGSVAFAEHIEVMETVTDEEGRYYFPAWGSLERPTKTYLRRGVRLYLFKEDYRYKGLKNEFRGRDDDRYKTIHRSEWNGKTVTLEKFEGSLKEYAKHISRLGYGLSNLRDDGCKWKQTPRIFLAFEPYNKIFKEANIHRSLVTLDSLFRFSQCGKQEDFLKELEL